jgi:hypothetical protein
MRRFHRIISGFALAALATTVGCSDQGPSATGSLSIRLKDAPGDVEHAVVTISQIYLQGTGGRTVLTTTPHTVDLTTLTGATTASLLDGAPVAAGTYSELRFVVSGAYIEVDNGDGTTSIFASSPNYAGLPQGASVAGPLQLPSLAQSGLKVDLTGPLTITGTQKVLVVDFDVSQSFGHATGAGASGWVMHPVIKGADVTLTGSVHATVQLGSGVSLPAIQVDGHSLTLADLSLTLTNTGDNTTSTVALTDAGGGVFAADFSYLTPGNYTVGFTLPAGMTSVTTTPAAPAPVTVQSGQQATVAFTITAAQ